jgi:hypothetical protein
LAKIFISYRSEDESFAAVTIDDALTERFGPGVVFRDSREIPPATDFRTVLWPMLAKCEVMIVVIGPRWLTGTGNVNLLQRENDFIRAEIKLALLIGLRVFPVLVGEVRMPAATDLPGDVAALASQQYVRLHARNAEYDMLRLINEVAAMIDPDGPVAGPAPRVRRTADSPPPTDTIPPARQECAILAMTLDDSAPADRERQLDAMRPAVRAAAAQAGLADAVVALREHPGGIDVVVGPQFPPVHLFDRFIPAVLSQLQAGSGAAGPRLRLGLDLGTFVTASPPDPASAAEHARELSQRDVVRRVLAATTSLVVVVTSDAFYQMVIRDSAGIDRSSFGRIPSGDGWVHVPGRSYPPGLNPSDPRVQPGSAPAAAAPTNANSIVVNGNVRGDVVNQKTVHNGWTG